MNMRTKRSASIGCMTLAMFATGISLCLSILTGWQLGDSILVKSMMAAFGVLAVLGAHLMPAICGSAPSGTRIVGLTLWAICLVYVAFSHASFFLASQQQTGMQRETLILSLPGAEKPRKELIEVLNDKVKVQTELSKLQNLCRGSCVKQVVAKTNMEARLAVLDVEEAMARNWQKKLEQRQRRQEIAHDDPVLGRLASWLGVTIVKLELMMGGIFSLILEGLACLCWYLILRPRDMHLTSQVTTTVMPTVTTDTNEVIGSQMSQMQPSQRYDDQIEQLAQLVKGGKIKLTVASIRAHCRCAQGKAADLKRLVQEKMNEECCA